MPCRVRKREGSGKLVAGADVELLVPDDEDKEADSDTNALASRKSTSAATVGGPDAGVNHLFVTAAAAESLRRFPLFLSLPLPRALLADEDENEDDGEDEDNVCSLLVVAVVVTDAVVELPRA